MPKKFPTQLLPGPADNLFVASAALPQEIPTMKPTNLMQKTAAKMTDAELVKAMAETMVAMKAGGSKTLQATRAAYLAVLKAEAQREARQF
jgi:hypothetical protein